VPGWQKSPTGDGRCSTISPTLSRRTSTYQLFWLLREADRVTSALLVVDVQNAVVDGIPGRDELIARIARLVGRARSAGRPVVWVQHEDEDLPHGSDGWRIVPELQPLDGEPIIEKHHRSAFGDTGLGDVLRTQEVLRLVIVGAQTAFCVDMAGKHALAEGFDVTWVSDGHANGDQETAVGAIPDADVRALLNRTWSTLRHPDRLVEVVPTDEVRW
jgi:nicotinamidase-related amidase